MPARCAIRPFRTAVGCLAAALAVAVLPSCFKVERTSTSRDVVPADWEGEWIGTWSASDGTGRGSMALHARSFEGLPVLQVETDNPCIGAASYTFARQGLSWELTGDDGTEFRGVLNPSRRQLSGTFACPREHGTWQVDFERSLPPIGDLGGEWNGSMAVVSPPVFAAIVLDLDQRWQGGVLRIGGVVHLWSLGLSVPIAEGRVDWRGDRFTLLLRTDANQGPGIWLQGRGSDGARSVEDGIFLVDDPRLPFRTGSWNAAWVGQ